MFREVKSLDEFNLLIRNETAVLAYFSTEVCNVCKVLKPRVEQLIKNSFPEICLVYVPSDSLPDVAAQNRIFAAPTLLVYFEGKEYIRKSRNVGIDELRKEISRPYGLIFGD